MSDKGDQPGRPTLRVISGDATPEEIAAILAVVAAYGGGAAAPDDDPEGSTWSRAHALRGVRSRGAAGWDLEPSANRWRASFWPR